MRKNIYGAVLTALVMFSACETVQPQDEEPILEPIEFTATIGVDTKTNIQWSDESQTYKTIWTEHDEILVLYDSGNWYRFGIADGAGTSTATFVGMVAEKSERYVALYSNDAGGYYDWLYTSVPSEQWLSVTDYGETTFDNLTSLMVARSESTSFEFKNICSVLKVSLTGNGEILRNVTFSANDSNHSASGDVDILFDGDEPYVAGASGNNWVSVSVPDFKLTSSPLDVYVVLLPGVYEGGFNLTVQTDKGMMYVSTSEDISFERSQIRTVNLAYEDTGDLWSISGDFNNWGNLIMEQEGDYLVARNVYLERRGWFRFKKYMSDDIYLGLSESFGWDNYSPTNTRCPLEYNRDTYMKTAMSGYYDIYLSLADTSAFVMSAGVPVENLPTLDLVAQPSYWDIFYMEDNNPLKVNGTVMAVCRHGYVIGLDGDNYDPFYIYYPQHQAEVGQNVDVYGTKSTYRDLPELINPTWSHVLGDREVYCDFMNITSEFSSYQSDSYSAISYVGVFSAEYNTITVEGSDHRKGKLVAPLEDYSYLDGQQVKVEGFYEGPNTESSYLYTIAVSVVQADGGGNTEEVIPGDELPVM